MPDFQQTVDLKKMGEKNRSSLVTEKKPAKVAKKKVSKKKSEEIDEIYKDDIENKEQKKDLHKIKRAEPASSHEGLYKGAILLLLIAIVGLVGYWMFFADKNTVDPASEAINEPSWYAIKLVTGEVYYGQVTDTAADPVIIEKVYYDYDQLNGEEKEKKETSNLRLVKRGKETHGPDGSMNLIRTHILYMEPLSEDSKVLKAILNYEN